MFGVHPAGVAMLVSGEAQMVNHSLEQGMLASTRDGSFVMVGSSLNKGLFSLIARKDMTDIKEVKGKRVAIGQVGDAPYNYTVALLGKNGIGVRDVQWIPVGTDVTGCAAVLESGRADATLLTAPNYFRLEEAGYKNLANLADHDDIFASTTYLFRKSISQTNPKLPELLIKAHAEAIKRFYGDEAFAIKAYIAFDKQPQADLKRIYDKYATINGFERVPYVLAGAIQSVVARQADERIATQMKSFDFHKTVDNSTIERLVREHFFEQLFGAGIKAEQDRKAKLAFR